MYIDLSSVSFARNEPKYWMLIVDDCTRMKWSLFLKQRSEVSEKFRNFLRTMRKDNANFGNIIRMDNAKENLAFKDDMAKESFQVKFELVAPNTPQQNDVVERAFATLTSRTRALFFAANFKKETKIQIWPEAVNTVCSENSSTSESNRRRHSQTARDLLDILSI